MPDFFYGQLHKLSLWVIKLLVKINKYPFSIMILQDGETKGYRQGYITKEKGNLGCYLPCIIHSLVPTTQCMEMPTPDWRCCNVTGDHVNTVFTKKKKEN